MGVATVGVLYLAVRRVAGPSAGLLAGAAMALTPVAVLMFRFNNPDALLVLLLTLAALRPHPGDREGQRPVAGAGRRPRRVRLPDQDAAGAARPPRVRAGVPGRRADDGCAAGCCTCWAPGWRCWCRPAGGWPSSNWCPASWRPYIGGSQTNSRVGADLGLQRPRAGSPATRPAASAAAAAAGARPASAGSSPPTSAARSPGCCPRPWSLGVAGLVAVGRAPRTDPRRAALLLWGGWLVVTGAGVQPDGRHLPRVLHGRPRPGDRGARRHRRRSCCGSGAAAPGPGSCWPRRWPAPSRGRGCCSPGPATTTPG